MFKLISVMDIVSRFCLFNDGGEGGGAGDGGQGGPGMITEAIGALDGNGVRGLFPQEIADKGYMKDVNSWGDIVKKLDGAQTLIGQRAAPAADASAEEWNAWFDKSGRPATAAEYDLGELNQVDGADRYKQALHNAGVLSVQAPKVMQELMAIENADNQAANAAYDKAMDAILGNDRAAKEAGAREYLTKLVPEAAAPIIDEMGPKELAMITAIASVMQQNVGAEDDIPGGGGSGAATSDTIQTELKALYTKSMSGTLSIPEQKEVAEQIRAKTEQLAKLQG